MHLTPPFTALFNVAWTPDILTQNVRHAVLWRLKVIPVDYEALIWLAVESPRGYMRNWKTAPQNSSVAKFIDCYWLLEKVQSDSGPEHPKLNPDPAGHMILSNPKQGYQYENESGSASGHGSHLILPHCKTVSMDHSQPFLILGIKFQVGALYSVKYPTPHPPLVSRVNYLVRFDDN